ncbi:hypothetical protein ACIBCM_22415 [Streptomyces sp. NPDC051018]|uniref:hypothetical protein n=1 Tax=Streptomyces sp. NPDC051018 TaxID=3365639 RepID=UPI0037B65992
MGRAEVAGAQARADGAVGLLAVEEQDLCADQSGDVDGLAGTAYGVVDDGPQPLVVVVVEAPGAGEFDQDRAGIVAAAARAEDEDVAVPQGVQDAVGP